MSKKDPRKRLTKAWIKRGGFTNGLWRLEERQRLAREAFDQWEKARAEKINKASDFAADVVPFKD
jgi:hypothetical protein